MSSININNTYYTTPITAQPVLPIADSVWSEYHELTRRVPTHEMKAIEDKILQLPDKDDKLAELQVALFSADWKASIFHNPDLRHYALLAFMKGGISRSVLSTILFYADAVTTYGINKIEVIPLFVNGSINSKGKQFFNGIIFGHYLRDQQIDQIYDEIKKLPACQQQFFLIKSHQTEKKSVRFVIAEAGLELFNFKKGDWGRIIPSMGIMQTFLQVYTGKDAVQLNPVLGLSSNDDLLDPTHRDMAVRFEGVSLPAIADEHPAPGFDFSYHDFFHAVLHSTPLRKVFLKMASFIREFSTLIPEGSKSFCEMENDFIDMEPAALYFYYPEYPLNKIFSDALGDILEYNGRTDLNQSFLAEVIKSPKFTNEPLITPYLISEIYSD